MITTPTTTPDIASHIERLTGSRSTIQPRRAAKRGAALRRKSALATVECMTPHTYPVNVTARQRPDTAPVSPVRRTRARIGRPEQRK